MLKLRRGWREEAWPRGICPSNPGTGRRAGVPCQMRWNGYGKLLPGISSNGSPTFGIMSTKWIVFEKNTSISNDPQHPVAETKLGWRSPEHLRAGGRGGE